MTDCGFLNIRDLLEIQNSSEPLFSSSNSSNNDLKNQMKEQIADGKGGVGFDLRLGSEYYLSGDNYTKHLADGETLTIEPGQFALLTTYEIFNMPPSLLAFISMKFSIKADGLINVSGFQVDPGYRGIFIFAVYNAGPLKVPLKYKERIFTVIFAKVEPVIEKRRTPVLTIDKKNYLNLMQNKNITQIALDGRITKLENWKNSIYYWIPIATVVGIGVATVLIDYVFTHGGKS